jgi:hypothetical protein
MPYQIELLMYSGRFTISEQIHQTNWNTKRFCIAQKKRAFQLVSHNGGNCRRFVNTCETITDKNLLTPIYKE